MNRFTRLKIRECSISTHSPVTVITLSARQLYRTVPAFIARYMPKIMHGSERTMSFVVQMSITKSKIKNPPRMNLVRICLCNTAASCLNLYFISILLFFSMKRVNPRTEPTYSRYKYSIFAFTSHRHFSANFYADYAQEMRVK